MQFAPPVPPEMAGGAGTASGTPAGPAPNMQDLYMAMANMSQLMGQQQPNLGHVGGAVVGNADLAHSLYQQPLPAMGQHLPGLGQYLVR